MLIMLFRHEDSCADGNDWHLDENVSLFGMEVTITPDFTTTAPTTTTAGPTDFPGMPDANCNFDFFLHSVTSKGGDAPR